MCAHIGSGIRRIGVTIRSRIPVHLYSHLMLHLWMLLALLQVGQGRPITGHLPAAGQEPNAGQKRGQRVPQLKDPFSSNSITRLDPMGQLHKYGFYGTSGNEDANIKKSEKSSMAEPLKRFQRFYGLNQTGVLDNETLTLMGTPRCGLPDIPDSNSSLSHRQRRFVALGRWRFNHLTYAVGRTSKLAPHDVERIIAKAFKLWSDSSGLTFTKVPVLRDSIIAISFHRYHHGDHDPFDGPGGVLAHAFFPWTGGDMHIDDDEDWTDGTFDGVNLYQIAAHELGHSLGLAHTGDRHALMYAFYKGYDPHLALGSDDIAGIQTLYGPPRPPPRPPTPQPQTPRPWTPLPQTPQPQTPRPWTPRPQTPRPQTPRPQTPRPQTPQPPTQRPFVPNPEACTGRGRFDAIFSINNKTYAIEGMQFYMLNDEAVEEGYPQHVHEALGNNINRVDTALVLIENRAEVLYLFEGTDVWKYDRLLRPYSSTPWTISSIFKGLYTNIDSAFFSEVYKAIYFFKDGGYYRSSSYTWSSNTYPIDAGYPRGVSVWNLQVRRIDAVFTWVKNRRVYIFSDNQYYRYNERELQVDTSAIPYPRDVKRWWLGCSDSRNLVAEIRHQNSSTNSTNKVIYHEKPSKDWKLPTRNLYYPPSSNDSMPGENRVLSNGIVFENKNSDPGLTVSIGVCVQGQYLLTLVSVTLVLCRSVLQS